MTTPAPVGDLIRATLHAQADGVREVGPLRLPDAAPTRAARPGYDARSAGLPGWPRSPPRR